MFSVMCLLGAVCANAERFSCRMIMTTDIDTCVSAQKHIAVDLGLSVKWAACNVGANTPEEYGDYYAWGETDVKTDYSLFTYKYCRGSLYSMKKYSVCSSYGNVDNNIVLDAEDDVAHVKWGGKWRMPNRTDFDELLNKCTWVWTVSNGVYGCRVIGTNGNSIFLPAGGCRYGTYIYSRSTYGGYWSSALNESGNNSACTLGFNSDGHGFYYYNRNYGLSVRPVCE